MYRVGGRGGEGGVGGSKMVVFRGKNGLNLGQIWVNLGRFLIIFHDCWVNIGGWPDRKIKCFGNVFVSVCGVEIILKCCTVSRE